MALSRRMLKAMGIEDEKIDEIITAHSDTVDALKEQRDQYKADAEKLPGVQKELTDLKDAAQKNGGSAWEVKYNAMKEEKERIEHEFSDFKSQTKAAETKAAKEKAYRQMLKEIGVSEKRIDAVMKVTDLDNIELDEQGMIKDADTAKANAMSEWSDFIVSTSTQGANVNTPPKNSGATKLTMADIYKKDDRGHYVMSTEERQKAIADNLSNKGE